MGLHSTPIAEEAPGLGACLHGQGEGRQIGSPLIDLHAVQIVGKNQSGDFARGIPLFLVDAVQQIESVGDHVSGTTCGIADSQLLRTIDMKELRLIILLRLGLDIVFPIPIQLAVGMILHPETSHRILH